MHFSKKLFCNVLRMWMPWSRIKTDKIRFTILSLYREQNKFYEKSRPYYSKKEMSRK